MNLNPLSLAIVNPRGAGVAAALFEDFTNSAVDFDSSITFTRGSQATYFDSAGTLKFAPSNMIRNNTMVGAVAGTPGTAPTNWTISAVAGITITTAFSTENGVDYAEVRFSGTTGGAGNCSIYVETATGVTATTGQTWSFSPYIKLQAGAFTNTTPILVMDENTGAGAFVANGTQAFTATTAGLATQRNLFTRTLSGGGTVGAVRPYVNLGVASGVAIDITLRIGLPQLQMGSDATPAIRTSGSAVYLPRSNAYQDYNPSTLAPLGFLIEQQSTNLLLWSEDFTNAAWTKSAATVTANAATAPTGTVIADKLVESAASSNHSATQAATVSSGAAYTASCFFKAAERTQCGFEIFTGASVYKAIFDISTGAFISAAGTGTYTIQACQNGWYRITITATTTTTTCNVFVYPASVGVTNYAGNGTSGIYVFGADLEAGAFATSYITTTTAAATRLADSASITGTNFSSWYNQGAGTFIATASSLQSTAGPNGVITAWDGTNNNRLILARPGNTANCNVAVRTGGVAQASESFGSWPLSASRKAGIAYAANDVIGVLAGTLSTNDTSVNLPTVDRLEIGGDLVATVKLNGWISSLSYYRTRLPNATLQSLTT